MDYRNQKNILTPLVDSKSTDLKYRSGNMAWLLSFRKMLVEQKENQNLRNMVQNESDRKLLQIYLTKKFRTCCYILFNRSYIHNLIHISNKNIYQKYTYQINYKNFETTRV